MRDYGISKCNICNNDFRKTGSSQIYCSTKCRTKDYREIIIKKCKNCNKEFEVVGNNNTWCSKKCKDAYFNAKYRSTKKFNDIKCVVCNELFTPKNYKNNTCSDKCRKVKKSSLFRRKNRKPVKIKEGVIFKEPKYENIKYSPVEDRAISILKNNGFTADQIGEVTGRKARSIRNRELEVSLDKYKYAKDLKNESTEIIKKVLTKLDYNTKLIESYSNNVVFNKLLENKFKIYKGREGSQFDIVLEKNNKFFKVQLKTTRYYEVANSFQQMAVTFYHYDIHKKKYDYFKYDDVDYFIFTCIGVDKAYAIPMSVIKKTITKPTSVLTFYPHRPHRFFDAAINTDNFFENFDTII